MSRYFVIEHPSRGWYTGSVYEWTKTGYAWVPKFKWSILGSDERVHRMYSKAEVIAERRKIPQKILDKCKVTEIGKKVQCC